MNGNLFLRSVKLLFCGVVFILIGMFFASRIFDPDNTAEDVTSVSWFVRCLFVLLVFPAMGVACIVECFAPAISKARRNRMCGRLSTVQANIERVEQDMSYTLTDCKPWRIHLSYWNTAADDRQQYEFISDYFWADPRHTIEAFGITELPVYVDPNNLKKYAVDTDVIRNKPTLI
ncbi:hypothetical protein FACS1894133_7580 [Clostridia bacterium]|nr:hypothetical protein FACS1894133_7580 [Clostridia bacterium]